MVDDDEGENLPFFVDGVDHSVISNSPLEADLTGEHKLGAAPRVLECLPDFL
jgi:hypothetical protein